ncbi:hypothetical protein SDC9_38416 [bioreactor metagenome]|uniref:Uncharacterized protein n=1 Tax=bioreactor metagenome TaxID=1076179 RepID=A0A644VLU5_9ZZZZ
MDLRHARARVEGRMPGGLARHAPVEHLVETDVIDVRMGAHLGAQHRDRMRREQFRDGAFRVVQIAEIARPADAGLDTGGQQPGAGAVDAEGALVGHLGLVVDEPRIIGAGLHAIGTAHAFAGIDQHLAGLGLEGRLDRADRQAGRIVAMVAQPRQHHHCRVLPVPHQLVDRDMGAEGALGHVVFEDAGDGAGLTADAFAQIDHHAPMRCRCRGGGLGGLPRRHDRGRGANRHPADRTEKTATVRVHG